jgi:WD40 repeat protein
MKSSIVIQLKRQLLINLYLILYVFASTATIAQDGKNSSTISNPAFNLKPLWSKQIDPRWEPGANVGNADDGITVEFVEFSADGTLLVTGNGLGEALILKATDGSVVKKFTYITPEDITDRTEFDISGGRMKGLEVECGTFTPDRKYVVLGGNLKGVQVFDLKQGSLVRNITVDEEVDGLGISADGRFFAHAAPKSVAVIDLHTWESIINIHHGSQEGVVNSVDFSPAGDLMVSAGNYGQVLVNRTSDWKLMGDGKIPDKSSIKSVRFSPDATLIAAGYSGGDVVVFDTKSMSLVKHFALFYIEAVAWTNDGKYLLAGGRDNQGRLRVYNTDNWQLTGDPKVQADRSNIEYIDVYKGKIAIAGEDAHVRLYLISY